MQVRNPKFNLVGTIDVEVNHEQYGWVPFTASSNDPEKYGQEIYAMAMAGAFGEIAPASNPADIDGELALKILRDKRKHVLETEVDPIVTNPLRWGALTDFEKQSFIDYRQQLLDITDVCPNPIYAWDNNVFDYKEKNFSFPSLT